MLTNVLATGIVLVAPAEVTVTSPALAVEDFLPTLLAFFGFMLLAPSLLGRLGAVLMGAGGAAKSTWKLLHAVWAVDVSWLDDLLFPLLAAGGLLLAVSLHRALRWWWWPLVVAGAVAAALAVTQRSVQPAFVFATAVVVWISVLGTVRASKQREGLAAMLFPVSILAVMVLVPLRGHAASDSLAFQWVQQGVNTAAQAIFLLAALLTHRAIKRGAHGVSPVYQGEQRWGAGADANDPVPVGRRHRL